MLNVATLAITPTTPGISRPPREGNEQGSLGVSVYGEEIHPGPFSLMAFPTFAKKLKLLRKTYTGYSTHMQEETGIYPPTG